MQLQRKSLILGGNKYLFKETRYLFNLYSHITFLPQLNTSYSETYWQLYRKVLAIVPKGTSNCAATEWQLRYRMNTVMVF